MPDPSEEGGLIIGQWATSDLLKDGIFVVFLVASMEPAEMKLCGSFAIVCHDEEQSNLSAEGHAAPSENPRHASHRIDFCQSLRGCASNSS